MKNIFSYFLIVYLLMLTLMPCPDKVVHAGTGKHEMVQQGQPGNNDDHHDCCSPLCTCSCCSLPFETAKTFIVTQSFSFSEKLVCFYNPEIESHYFFSIWEPPKA
jgi:hypothetical protein